MKLLRIIADEMPTSRASVIGGAAFAGGTSWLRRSMVLSGFFIALMVSGSRASAVEVEFRQDAGKYFVEASGLSPETLEQLQADEELKAAAGLLQVFTGAEGAPDQPPLLGTYRLDGQTLVFEPRFPLRPGRVYRAVASVASEAEATTEVDPSKLGLVTIFEVPRGEQSAPTKVEAIFPSGDVLPENQLKFYVHFSAPMARGEVYEHVQLLNEQGQPIDYPFVNVGQELWDRSGTRVTLLLDPGRIKRGLKPREELGPILEEGHSYTLVVQESWRDAAGHPLTEAKRKSFKVTAPDDTQPDPAKWRINRPPADGRQPLAMYFEEPLDHAMLMRVLNVVDGQGKPVPGDVQVGDQEQRWSFAPRQPWQPGEYHIVIATTLEDRAGNSIERPFEVDVFERIEAKVTTETVELPFRVR
ncbi:MAG: hypothetical protein WDZ59_16555 [Pirellulales bacterium]